MSCDTGKGPSGFKGCVSRRTGHVPNADDWHNARMLGLVYPLSSGEKAYVTDEMLEYAKEFNKASSEGSKKYVEGREAAAAVRKVLTEQLGMTKQDLLSDSDTMTFLSDVHAGTTKLTRGQIAAMPYVFACTEKRVVENDIPPTVAVTQPKPQVSPLKDRLDEAGRRRAAENAPRPAPAPFERPAPHPGGLAARLQNAAGSPASAPAPAPTAPQPSRTAATAAPRSQKSPIKPSIRDQKDVHSVVHDALRSTPHAAEGLPPTVTSNRDLTGAEIAFLARVNPAALRQHRSRKG